jgi:hypothetical protein
VRATQFQQRKLNGAMKLHRPIGTRFHVRPISPGRCRNVERLDFAKSSTHAFFRSDPERVQQGG